MKLKTEEYVIHCWDLADEYLKGIDSGEIISNKWIKAACDRHVNDLKRDDLIFDSDAVSQVFRFFSFLNVNVNNIYRQFELLPYQAFAIVNLFGFYWKESGKRRFRYAYLFMARKNGKTTFSAALQLYGLVADGVQDAQSLLVASTREQASIALGYITGIVSHTPALSKRLEPQRSKIIPKDRKNQAFCKTLASNANKLDGYSASMAILDEVHSYPDDALFNVIKSSILARENPLIFLITTAGFSLDSFCYDHTEYCKNIVTGEITDDATFAMVFALDEGDKMDDAKMWGKSNPALGKIIYTEDLLTEFNQSKHSHSQLYNFITKHLNVFVESSHAWIPEMKLNPQFKVVKEEDFLGKECYIGVDLSSTRDLTSIVLLFFENNHYYVIPYFFFANNADKMVRKGGIKMDEWIKKGYVYECKSETIDYDLLYEKMVEINSKFDVRIVNYDTFNSALLIPKIQEHGVYCKPFAQTAQRFSEPLKYIEKLIYDKRIDLSDNPTLLWNFRNTVLFTDGNGNIKIMKNKSRDAVDGAVSLAMAMDGFLEFNKYDISE